MSLATDATGAIPLGFPVSLLLPPPQPSSRTSSRGGGEYTSTIECTFIPFPVMSLSNDGERLGVGRGRLRWGPGAIDQGSRSVYSFTVEEHMSRTNLREVTSHLRSNQTTSEVILWNRLRNRQLLGLKFRRQHPLLGKVVDFYCPAKKLVIEVDGSIHDKIGDSDRERDYLFSQKGYYVLRVRNEDVNRNVNNVLPAMESIACV